MTVLKYVVHHHRGGHTIIFNKLKQKAAPKMKLTNTQNIASYVKRENKNNNMYKERKR